MNQHEVVFVPNGRGKAQCAPNPNYPNGQAFKLGGSAERCTVELPYPAPECGWFRVTCKVCKLSTLITAAGRPDDPISVELPCASLVKHDTVTDLPPGRGKSAR